ncbi:glycosyltransferase family 2 protein [Patescibacteria group bacterium]|nr:glycosyltransferase family 2 protein [Patescibacteria group bacterium]
MPQNKEGRGIVSATFVTPALDEAEHILALRDNIREQRENLAPHVSLRLIIADNGSGQETQEIYNRITSDEKQRGEDKLRIDVLHGSERGFHSRARNQGIRYAIDAFHQEHPEMEPENHVIVNFDADTIMKRPDVVQVLTQEVFADPKAETAYGPIMFRSSTGKESAEYPLIQKPFSRLLLGHFFRLNGRRMKDYINPPYVYLHSIFNSVRESAIVEKGNPNKIEVEFNPNDRVGVDTRMSLLLQRHLHTEQIVFDKRLAALTSARGYEREDGNISRLKFTKRAFKLFVGTQYTPYAVARDLERYPEEERKEIERNLRFSAVVGSFIRDVDAETYGLSDDEKLVLQAVNARKAEKYKQGAQVVPAKNLITGELLPGKFAVIAHVGTQGK